MKRLCLLLGCSLSSFAMDNEIRMIELPIQQLAEQLPGNKQEPVRRSSSQNKKIRLPLYLERPELNSSPSISEDEKKKPLKIVLSEDSETENVEAKAQKAGTPEAPLFERLLTVDNFMYALGFFDKTLDVSIETLQMAFDSKNVDAEMLQIAFDKIPIPIFNNFIKEHSEAFSAFIKSSTPHKQLTLSDKKRFRELALREIIISQQNQKKEEQLENLKKQCEEQKTIMSAQQATIKKCSRGICCLIGTVPFAVCSAVIITYLAMLE